MKSENKATAKATSINSRNQSAKTEKTTTENNATSAQELAKEKAAIRKEVADQKNPPNLETTLQLLENLQTRMRQRNKLIHTIENLNSFELEITNEEDEFGSHRFHGCELKISDDNRKEFITGNPVVIAAVAEFVKNKCLEKLAEIEATIVLP